MLMISSIIMGLLSGCCLGLGLSAWISHNHVRAGAFLAFGAGALWFWMSHFML